MAFIFLPHSPSMVMDSIDRMSLKDTLAILNLTRCVYPAAVLVIFLVSFVIFGVVNSPVENDRVLIDSLRGPGGRPLPTRRKSNNQVREAVAVRDFSPRAKTVFALLQAVILATFVADGVAVILQVISGREDHWWPGQSAVVRLPTETKLSSTRHANKPRFSWLVRSSCGW